MLWNSLAAVFSLIITAECRDSSKLTKYLPGGISNSFVNLGKIDISYHFNMNPESPIKSEASHSMSTFFSKPQLKIDEPCLCSSLRNIKEPIMNSNPSQILQKILMNSDLFSFNKEPVSSTLCCESQEHVQEDTIYFEFGPKKSEMSLIPLTNSPNQQPLFKDSVKKLPLPSSPINTKIIDIIYFPKKDLVTFDYKRPKTNNAINKENIQIVGDKELKNEFKNYKIIHSTPIVSKKKELNKQNIQESKVATKEEIPQTTTHFEITTENNNI